MKILALSGQIVSSQTEEPFLYKKLYNFLHKKEASRLRLLNHIEE